MEGKRIVFTTATPNDQGGVIPNESLNFSRFNLNPVVLCQHDWSAPPLGLMTDIKKDKNGNWTGVPVFHGITKESAEYKAMYEGGWIKACSIGGEAEWQTNNASQPILDKAGNKICEKFNLYEISIVTLPSNHQAVTTDEQLTAKIYEKADLQSISDSIVTLSSKYKTPLMSVKKTTPAQVKLTALKTALDAAKAVATPDADTIAALTAAVDEAEDALAVEVAKTIRLNASSTGGNNSPSDPSAGQLPGVIKDLVNNNTSLMGKVLDFFMGGKKADGTKLEAPAMPGQPTSTIKDPTQPQPTPTGLEAAKAKAEQARQAAQAAQAAAASAKEKAEKEGSTQADKDGYASALAAAEKACNDALEAESAYKSCMDSDGGADMATKNATALAAAKVVLAAHGLKIVEPGQPATQAAAPKVLTMEELKAAQLKLAAPPTGTIDPIVLKNKGVTFTQLSADKNEEGMRILGRVMTNDENKSISDYQVVLQALMCDEKYGAIVKKTRIIANVAENQLNSLRRNRSYEDEKRSGMTLHSLLGQLQAGYVEALGRDNSVRSITNLGAQGRQMLKLNSTDNALASPALTTIEWLSLAIFALFPSTSWKNDIPMFGAQMTSENTGLIWANVAADPTITFGTQPVNPADYQIDDDAVSLTLIPSWLQPMLWTPMTLHQLRYDKMAVQWAQAFAKWGAAIDEKLIYTLASTVPAGSIIQSIGQTSGQVPLKNFNLTGANDPNAFLYNPNLVATLAAPAYNDITRIEQIYNKQNFQLESETPVLVVDPTQSAFIDLDPATQSLLTRWTNSNATDLLKIKHTKLNQRSKVAIYDPATGQVKDPSGIIPATAVSAGIGFIPNQVGIGLGILDVFMVQDPTAYGYRMSADIREGIVPLRKNFNGTVLYTYGAANV